MSATERLEAATDAVLLAITEHNLILERVHADCDRRELAALDRLNATCIRVNAQLEAALNRPIEADLRAIADGTVVQLRPEGNGF